jgi:hypothetical protein
MAVQHAYEPLLFSLLAVQALNQPKPEKKGVVRINCAFRNHDLDHKQLLYD